MHSKQFNKRTFSNSSTCASVRGAFNILFSFNLLNAHASVRGSTVPVEPEAQAKTTFTTPFGLFQFQRMPFGLQGAPATFQRIVDKLLDGLQHCANAYLDDIVIYSGTLKDHLQHLTLVLDRIRTAGLTIKPKKKPIWNKSVCVVGVCCGEWNGAT